MAQTSEPLSVSIEEARRLLGIGLTKIYGLIDEGRLRKAKIGRRTLIEYASLKTLLNQAFENAAKQERQPAARRHAR